MDVNEIIDGAIDYIQTNGWCRGALTKPDGSACMRGAMMMGAGATLDSSGEVDLSKDTGFDWPAFNDATQKVEAEIYRETSGLLAVPDYNDLVATSQEDVLLILKRAREA